jgi:hypothetical protein
MTVAELHFRKIYSNGRNQQRAQAIENFGDTRQNYLLLQLVTFFVPYILVSTEKNLLLLSDY